MDATVTVFMPCSSAFPERVARVSFSTELGEVNMHLKAYITVIQDHSRSQAAESTADSPLLAACPAAVPPKGSRG